MFSLKEFIVKKIVGGFRERVTVFIYNDDLEILVGFDPRTNSYLFPGGGIDHNEWVEGVKRESLEEVGAIFNVTRERVRQIEAKALKKLRHPTRARKLKNFLSVGFS